MDKQGPRQHESPRRVRKRRPRPESLYVTVLRRNHLKKIQAGICEIKTEEVSQQKPKKPSLFKRMRNFLSRTFRKRNRREESVKNQVIEEISSNEENLDEKVSRALYDELNSNYQACIQQIETQNREIKKQTRFYSEEIENKQKTIESIEAENARLQNELAELRRQRDIPKQPSEQELSEQRSYSKKKLKYRLIIQTLKAENKILHEKFGVCESIWKESGLRIQDCQRKLQAWSDELKSIHESSFCNSEPESRWWDFFKRKRRTS